MKKNHLFAFLLFFKGQAMLKNTYRPVLFKVV